MIKEKDMQKKLFVYILFLLMLPSVCMAAPDGAIFKQLADKAQNIGIGLRDAGFIIAGMGLIVFSFMAIFNKISWKTLAYIMLSCFILSLMCAVINYIGHGSAHAPALSYDVHRGSVGTTGQNVKNNPVQRGN